MQGQRLKKIREILNITQEDLAKQFNISRRTIINYENSDDVPGAIIQLLLKTYNVNPFYILNDKEPVLLTHAKILDDMGKGKQMENSSDPYDFPNNLSLDKTDQPIDNHENDLVNIDIVELDDSNWESQPRAYIKTNSFTVVRKFFAPFTPDQVKAAIAHGDAMEPTLCAGDVVFFEVDSVGGNGLYILDASGDLVCRRVEFRLDGSMLLVSDNQRYQPEPVPKDADNDLIRICGKVIGWFHLQRK